MSAATKSSTKKKTTAAKPAAKKTTAAKPRTAAASTARKKPAAKAPTKTARKKTPAKMQSFRLSRESEQFISTKITTQTVYWSILAIAILILGFKVLDAQLETLEALNQLAQQI